MKAYIYLTGLIALSGSVYFDFGITKAIAVFGVGLMILASLGKD